jgi:hypothetical protein
VEFTPEWYQEDQKKLELCTIKRHDQLARMNKNVTEITNKKIKPLNPTAIIRLIITKST